MGDIDRERSKNVLVDWFSHLPTRTNGANKILEKGEI